MTIEHTFVVDGAGKQEGWVLRCESDHTGTDEEGNPVRSAVLVFSAVPNDINQEDYDPEKHDTERVRIVLKGFEFTASAHMLACDLISAMFTIMNEPKEGEPTAPFIQGLAAATLRMHINNCFRAFHNVDVPGLQFVESQEEFDQAVAAAAAAGKPITAIDLNKPELADAIRQNAPSTRVIQ